MSGSHKTRHRGQVLTLHWKTALDVESRVVVGPGALDKLADTLAQLSAGKKVLVVAQPGVLPDWTAAAVAALNHAGFTATTLTLADGEAVKGLDSLETIWRELAALKLARNDTLVAVGGGALTDVAGFAASTFKRGVNLVLVPTTLLAQVDASIGGKTAINLGGIKNIAGTFYFPKAVLADPEALAGLPGRQFVSGLAEVIKYALIEKTVAGQSEYRQGPRPLIDLLEMCAGPALDESDPALPGIITASIKMKLAVVGADPYERGLRRALNLGHTLGHAIETVSAHSLTHGEAIAVGMAFALKLSVSRELIDGAAQARAIALMQKCGLPVELPEALDRQALLAAMAQDKKREGESIRFILPAKGLGNVDYAVDLTAEEVGRHL